MGKPWCVHSTAGQIVPVTLALLTPLPLGSCESPSPPHFRMCAVGTSSREAVCHGTQTQSFHEQLRNSRNSLYFGGFLSFSALPRGRVNTLFSAGLSDGCPSSARWFSGLWGREAACPCLPLSYHLPLGPPYPPYHLRGFSLIFLPYVLYPNSRSVSPGSSALLMLQEKGSCPPPRGCL